MRDLLDDPQLRRSLDRSSNAPAAVRAALARCAARLPGEAEIQCLEALLVDEDPEVQVAAIEACRDHGGDALDPARWEVLSGSSDPRVRAAAVSAVSQLETPLPGWLCRLADDPAWQVRLALAECLVAGLGRSAEADHYLETLQRDDHPLIRAAALTPATAQRLTREPDRETSWHVLKTAARLAKLPFWELEPSTTWQPEHVHLPDPAPIALPTLGELERRRLGPGELLVSPLCISGHYRLPAEGFARAVEAGVNLFFWEPNYDTLIDFADRIGSAGRQRLHFTAGTFEADPRRIRKDVDRALARLQIDRLALFLIFWVRSWSRISDEVRRLLEDLQAAGKLAQFGLSTHSRPLAVEAIGSGWNPVMVRHSAAHRGAESQVIPAARQAGSTLLTFNSTCYGRLLRDVGTSPALTAADCYRYSLAQPGVTACWSAPSTLEELSENLTVLADPQLSAERREEIAAHGKQVYEQDKLFDRHVRSLA